MSKRRVRWVVIVVIVAGAALMLGMCFFCCRSSSFNFRFGLPGQKKNGELVTGQSRVLEINHPGG